MKEMRRNVRKRAVLSMMMRKVVIWTRRERVDSDEVNEKKTRKK